ncbi:MAG: proline--tRNA ligase [Patescibacteria group bacterium]
MSDKKVNIAKRSEDYSRWYLDVIKEADLAEHSAVKGCMVIKPHGYALWENIQRVLDRRFKETGHQNAYFPLFVPKSFLSREASHVKGFAKECAVVTHHRLIDNPSGEGVVVDPTAKLEEEVVVRPTSETIIYDAYSRWVNSWRDLPLLINQWANVVRWEMRTRLFLRTTEFLWQEGHTAHATHEEAEVEALKMLEVYREFSEDWMAMPVITGRKPDHDRFPGALVTYCIEAIMQDGKALQAGTSHDLGQNFAHAFDVKFMDKDGETKFVWQTSWGVSTRLIGGLIMAHSDDNGLVLPPKLAPIKIVIVPIFKEDDKETVLREASNLRDELRELDDAIRLDDCDNYGPGFKFNEWERKGVPVRIELGPKDIEKGSAVVVRRDTGEKQFVSRGELKATVERLLVQIQTDMFERAKKFRTDNSREIDSYDEFRKFFADEGGGFAYCHWCGRPECDERAKEEAKAGIRCIPFSQKKETGRCVLCDGESEGRVIFAKAY